jgi:RNA 2',3'-cyclic 3'-phosphodiesterase
VTLGRYFLALRPDAAAAASLARLPIPDGARPTHPEDLHLTVLFIGALQGQGEDDVLAAVRRAHGEVAAQPVVVLDCVEHWPGPRVLCAGGPTDPALADLQAALRGQLAALGLAPDARPLRSHVTLARKVTGRAAPTVPLDPAIGWRPGAVLLMASDAGAAAPPRYRVRGEVPLAPPR